MEFRWLLGELNKLGNGRNAYTSGQIADSLRVLHKSDPVIQRLATTKKISNDMDRLYRMGFLSRTRKKRRVITRNGKGCNRGFIYLYRFSKQGNSYCSYLTRRKMEISMNELARRNLIVMRQPQSQFLLKKLKTAIHPENRVALLKILEYHSTWSSKDPFRGRYKRFPPKRDYQLFEIMRTLLKTSYRDKRSITALANLVEHLRQNGKFDEDAEEKTDRLLEELHQSLK